MRDNLDVRHISATGMGIILTVILVVGVVFALLRLWNMPAGPDRGQLSYEPAVTGTPLETAPQPALADYRHAKARRLHSLGWVDRQAGIVHIPIDVAMRMLAAASAASGASAEPAEPAASAEPGARDAQARTGIRSSPTTAIGARP